MSKCTDLDGRGALFLGVLNGQSESCIQCGVAEVKPGPVLMYRNPTGQIDPICSDCAFGHAKRSGRRQAFLFAQLNAMACLIGHSLQLTEHGAPMRPLWLHMSSLAKSWGWSFDEDEGNEGIVGDGEASLGEASLDADAR